MPDPNSVSVIFAFALFTSTLEFTMPKSLFVSTLQGPLNRVPLGRLTSKMVSARIPLAQVRALHAAAEQRRVPLGAYIRDRLATLASGVASDPAKTLSEVAKALGLDPSTSPADVLAAIQDLVSVVTDPGGDPAAEAPDVATEAASLSPEWLSKIRARGMTPLEFVRKKRASTRRV